MWRVLIGVFVFAAATMPAFGQDQFPDVSKEDRSLDRLMRSLLHLSEFGVDIGAGWSSSPQRIRMAMASIVSDAIDRLPNTFRTLLTTESEQRERRVDAVRWRSKVPLYAYLWRSEFKSVITELSPEIKKLGGDPKKMYLTIDGYQKYADPVKAGGAPEFRDVPRDHWAASAVQELRDAGILSGYPDGTFRGSGAIIQAPNKKKI